MNPGSKYLLGIKTFLPVQIYFAMKLESVVEHLTGDREGELVLIW